MVPSCVLDDCVNYMGHANYPGSNYQGYTVLYSSDFL